MIAQENYGEKQILNLEEQEFRVKSMARDVIKEWDKYDLGLKRQSIQNLT